MKIIIPAFTLGLLAFVLIGCGGNFNGGDTGSSGGLLVQGQNGSVPAAPSALTITSRSNTGIYLSWTDNSANEDGFRIERRIGANAYAQLITLGPNIVSYIDNTVSPLTQYTYRVVAYNSFGDSNISNEVTATPPLVKTWGGLGDETANAVAVDGAGNIYVTGWTYSFGAITSTPTEVFVIKYNSQGTLLWQKNWGGLGNDSGNAIAVSQFGDVYVAGSTEGFGVVSTTDVFVLKYTTNGILSWQKTWGGNGQDIAYDIALDELLSHNRIYVTGSTDSFGAGNNDAFLLSYDTAGNLNWQRVWGDHGINIAHGVDTDSLGDIYVAGGSNSNTFGSNTYDAFILKYNANGTLTWQRIWGGMNDEIAKDIVVDASDNIYLAGDSIEYGSGAYNTFVLCYDSVGTNLWQDIWSSFAGNEFTGGIAVSGSNLYINGYSNGFGDQTNNIFIIRINSSTGSLLYQECWSTPGADTAYGITADSSNNVFIAGATNSSNGWLTNIPGFIYASNEISSPAFGTITIPSGTETIPAGIENVPNGIETGSSILDMLLIKIKY
ncbi:MAG: SBBP repeat-containing protein [Planctomycetota bacterium]